MKSWDTKFEQKLLTAPNYRAFAQLFFEKKPQWSSPRPLTFSTFAERSGYASKGFMNDVIAGRKRILPSSFDRIAKGLRLNSTWTEYFRCLVALEHEEFHSTKRSAEYFIDRVGQLRLKLQKRAATTPLRGLSPLIEAYLQPEFPEVYAALGNVEMGETRETIAARANLNPNKVAMILAKMQDVGLVNEKRETGRIVPNVIALEAEELGSSEVFKADYKRAQDRARERFKTQANSSESLFMTQTFSVSRQDLTRLKRELGELIRNFAVDAEKPNGDTVAEVSVSFTNNR